MHRSLLRILFLITISSLGCKSDNITEQNKFSQHSSKTMGTSYTVKYLDQNRKVKKQGIDSLLKVLDKSELSTYSKKSAISRFNSSKALKSDYTSDINPHFISNFLLADSVFYETDGAFEPTVMPLVNYWGFGYTERLRNRSDSLTVDSLLRFVGLDKMTWAFDSTLQIVKNDPPQMLDFSAIAKGYASMVVGDWLENREVKNYYVEIGGEVCVMGQNPSNKPWTLGVVFPSLDPKSQTIYKTLALNKGCVASSGNYRNYYIYNDKIYSHTIDPETGFPMRSNTLSVTVVSQNGGRADALATAGMVMEEEKFVALIDSLGDAECLVLYADDDGEIQELQSSEMSKYLIE